VVEGVGLRKSIVDFAASFSSRDHIGVIGCSDLTVFIFGCSGAIIFGRLTRSTSRDGLVGVESQSTLLM
jgi:hypothetical protein